MTGTVVSRSGSHLSFLRVPSPIRYACVEKRDSLVQSLIMEFGIVPQPHDFGGYSAVRRSTKRWVETTLDTHHVFMWVILRGVNGAGGRLIAQLRGSAMTLARMALAEFLGVSTGVELSRLRVTHEVLGRWEDGRWSVDVLDCER